MKRWDGAQHPQALGSKKMKENRIPRAPKDLQKPGTINIAAREEEQRARCEEQRQALLQRFPQRPPGRPQQTWKGQMKSCDYVRHPKRPIPIHMAQRICVPDTALTRNSPTRKAGMTCTASLIKGDERNTCSLPGLNGGRGVPVTGTPHATCTRFVQDPTHTVQQRDNRPRSVALEDPPASSKTHGLGHALLPQAQAKYPDLDSQPLTSCGPEFGPGPKISLQAPGKRADRTSTQTCQNPQKKPRLSPSLPPGLRPAVEMQAPTMTTAQGQSIDPQPPHKGTLRMTLHVYQAPPHPAVLGFPTHPSELFSLE
uniref:Uncharacterized protein n=2 Tax=Molossus molossus TaxID=27622 RepID=A0A7J8GQS0_MOLMO|nr:hypothetical protein HJG59_011347 [Molossus molossus]